jgi:hypothetical protein
MRAAIPAFTIKSLARMLAFTVAVCVLRISHGRDKSAENFSTTSALHFDASALLFWRKQREAFGSSDGRHLPLALDAAKCLLASTGVRSMPSEMLAATIACQIHVNLFCNRLAIAKAYRTAIDMLSSGNIAVWSGECSAASLTDKLARVFAVPPLVCELAVVSAEGIVARLH